MSDLKQKLSAVALLLASIGVPGAGILVFTRYVETHPVIAALFTLAYEIFLGLFAIITRIWNSVVLDSWLKSFMEVIDKWGRERLKSSRKRYYDHLRFNHRHFDMKALSKLTPDAITLDEGFVETYLENKPPLQANPNPVYETPGAGVEGTNIWDYLIAPQFRERSLMIIASAGRGKTTLLQHIVLTLVTKNKKHRKYLSSKVPHKVPVLLFLRDIAERMKPDEGNNFSLIDILSADLKKIFNTNSPAGWLEKQMDKGHCLIMLDGLDEIPHSDLEMRKKVARWIQQQMGTYAKNRFIVTSRPFGFLGTPLDNLDVLEIRLFKFPQMQDLVYKRFLAHESKKFLAHESKKINQNKYLIEKEAENKTANLLLQLRDNPNLLDFAVNPLLLTMIVLVHINSPVLPKNRTHLYASVCEVSFGARREAQGQALEMPPDQMEKILQPLAYHMMKEGKTTISFADAQKQIKRLLEKYPQKISPAAFLQLVEDVSGLLLKKEQNQYVFAHKTFQEYLAAGYIKEKHRAQELVDQVRSQSNLDWWRETICHYCSMADGTAIVRACLDVQPASEDMLVLAFDCLDMAGQLEEVERDELDSLESRGVEHSNPHIQRAMWGVRLKRRSAQMLRLDEKTYIDKSLITCAEYQLFLDSQRDMNIYCQPDHWSSETFQQGDERAPVLGVRYSDARDFCQWLTKRQGGHWRYRLPQASELERIVDPGSVTRTKKKVSSKLKEVVLVSDLPHDTGYWIDGSTNFKWARSSRHLPKNFLRNRWASDGGDQLLGERVLSRASLLHPGTDLHLCRVLEQLERLDPELKNEIEKVVDRLSGITAGGLSSIDFANMRRAIIQRLRTLYASSPDDEGMKKKIFVLMSKPTRLFHSSSHKFTLENVRESIDVFIHAYVSLAIIEARKANGLPPCEGILLVKQYEAVNQHVI